MTHHNSMRTKYEVPRDVRKQYKIPLICSEVTYPDTTDALPSSSCIANTSKVFMG